MKKVKDGRTTIEVKFSALLKADAKTWFEDYIFNNQSQSDAQILLQSYNCAINGLEEFRDIDATIERKGTMPVNFYC